ncbi:hypothetical protein EJ08DRAFT_737296 [Tothia fuscella]|uniref:Uncharacterized protein n=1 Tax=Tothia fuscella TaxID=1048955 RepID=A0A9P4NJN1_9PEZI|nr:hypothetical protein EJ08DRAFT_737296 [Tothia fuscella]
MWIEPFQSELFLRGKIHIWCDISLNIILYQHQGTSKLQYIKLSSKSSSPTPHFNNKPSIAIITMADNGSPRRASGTFGNLMDQKKRHSTDISHNERRLSHSEMGAKPGILGSMWNNLVKPGHTQKPEVPAKPTPVSRSGEGTFSKFGKN